MVARLIPLAKQDRRQVQSNNAYELTGGVIHIAEDPEQGLVMGDAGRVTRCDAILELKEQQWFIRSSGSSAL